MKKILAFVAFSALWLLSGFSFAGPSTVGTWHTMPGVACSAYNNSQADRLTRDHARIFLPADGPSTGLWVLCPLQAVNEDLKVTTNPPAFGVTAFFDAGVATNTDVTCIVRFFSFDTLHVPGDSSSESPDEAHALVATKNAGISVSQAVFAYDLFLTDYEDFAYYTVACKLYPGTGLNSVDINQQ